MAAPAPAATQTLPGAKFFAPQARLVTQDGQPLLVGNQSIDQDLMSVTVTQPCTGVGQVEITLNNQRFGSPNPRTPPWKYNGLKQAELAFGTRLRVDLRYGQDPWTPMMLVRVTNAGFAFPSAAGATVTVTGEDMLSLLRTKPTKPVKHRKVKEFKIVEDELKASGSGLTVFLPAPSDLFSSPLAELTHEPSQSYLQFIQSLAERMDYEVYVGFDKPGDPFTGEAASKTGAKSVINADVKLHFSPARSAVLGNPIPLAWGLDIVEFKPTFKIWDILTEAKVTGGLPRARGRCDPPEPIKMDDAIKGDLHPAPGQSAPISAIEARKRALETEAGSAKTRVGPEIEANVATVEVKNLDTERATRQGIAALRKSAREFLTAEITTIGYARLRPGIHVNLTGFYAPFDGIYYITQAVHTLSSAGYTTKISVRRPGMLDPSGYPGG